MLELLSMYTVPDFEPRGLLFHRIDAMISLATNHFLTRKYINQQENICSVCKLYCLMPQYTEHSQVIA